MPSTREMLSPDFITNENCLALHELIQSPPKAREYSDSDVQMNEINKCLSLLSPFLELLQQQYAELKLTIGRIAQAEEGVWNGSWGTQEFMELRAYKIGVYPYELKVWWAKAQQIAVQMPSLRRLFSLLTCQLANFKNRKEIIIFGDTPLYAIP